MIVPLAGLAVFGAGLLALLFALAADVIVRAFAKSAEGLGIGPFNLGAMFESMANTILDVFTALTAPLWEPVAHWVYGHAWLFGQAFFDVARAIFHVGDQIAHIVTSAIPEAAAQTRSWALETAMLLKHETETTTGQIMANVAAVIAGAGSAIYGLINLGGPGPRKQTYEAFAETRKAAENHTDGTVSSAKELLEGRISDVQAKLEGDLTRAKETLGRAVAEAAEGVRGELRNAEHELLYDIGVAEARATTHLTEVAAALGQAISHAEGTAQTRLEEARQALGRTISNNAAGARGELERERIALENKIQGAEGAAKAKLDAAKAELEHELAGAEGVARAELSETRSKLELAAGEATGAVRAELQKAVDSLTEAIGVVSTTYTGQLERLFTGTIEDITNRSVATHGDLSALPALLAAAIVTPLAALAGRVSHLEDCAVTSCPGKNNFSELLKAALGADDALLLLSFLERARHDPKGAGEDFASWARGMYTTVEEPFELLLNL